jgi:hypothetical protein
MAWVVPIIYTAIILLFVVLDAFGSRESGKWLGLRLFVLFVVLLPFIAITWEKLH